MSETAKWYVIHTYSGYENKVANNIETAVENQNLRELIEEVCVPTERCLSFVMTAKNGKWNGKFFRAMFL